MCFYTLYLTLLSRATFLCWFCLIWDLFFAGQIIAKLLENVKLMENQWWLLFWFPLMQKYCLDMQIIDFKISASCPGTFSWFYPVFGIEEGISYYWAMQRNGNVRAQPEFTSKGAEAMRAPSFCFCVPAEQPKVSESGVRDWMLRRKPSRTGITTRIILVCGHSFKLVAKVK